MNTFKPENTGLAWFNATLVCAVAAFLVFLVDRSLVFGSHAGYWNYPFIRNLTWRDARVAVAAALAFGIALHMGMRHIDHHPRVTVAAWLALGLGFNLLCCVFWMVPLGHIVASDGCTSFYSVTLLYPPSELLARFTNLAQTLPVHAQANMPGKEMVYYVLGWFSGDPTMIGVALVAISCSGGLLVYWLAARWFGDRRPALLALVLYLVFPSRIAFSPVLNSVSPVFILAALLLLDLYLAKPRDLYLWLLGVAVYVVWFVDPLLLASGVIFIGLVARGLTTGELPWRRLWRVAAYPLAGLLLTYGVMWLVCRFDTLEAFRWVTHEAYGFNQRAKRPYDVWVVANLKEFLFGAGLSQGLVCVASLYLVGSQIASARWSRAAITSMLSDPTASLLVSLSATLLILDFAGVNRGETSRLWIFLAIFLQMACAGACFQRFGPSTARVVVVASAFQSTLVVASVGYLLC